jgi:hypothetical protein
LEIPLFSHIDFLIPLNLTRNEEEERVEKEKRTFWESSDPELSGIDSFPFPGFSLLVPFYFQLANIESIPFPLLEPLLRL